MTGNSAVQAMYAALAVEDVKPKKRQASWEEYMCSVCGEVKETLPAGALMGMTFGSWQELSKHTTTSRLCKACAWAFKDKRLLRSPVWITRDTVEFLDWAELGIRLTSEEVTSQVAVVAPHGGRKIVAPYARWGYVAADNGALQWAPAYRKALAVCHQLHKVGVRGSLLSLDSPPSQQVMAVEEPKQRVVYEMWEYLRFVREDKTLLGLFTKLSMNMSNEKEE